MQGCEICKNLHTIDNLHVGRGTSSKGSEESGEGRELHCRLNKKCSF